MKPASGESAMSAAATGSMAGMEGMAGMSAVATGSSDPDAQGCAECGGHGTPKETTGAAVLENGVQVISIAVDGGYYVPNTVTASAGTPIKVVFTGKAKGCVAKPTFKSLGKSGDLTGAGTATIDLGTLAPGVHEFTCAMGMNTGTITVE
jgi:plastocyanin